jgi:hypothetical protein
MALRLSQKPPICLWFLRRMLENDRVCDKSLFGGLIEKDHIARHDQG